jgi:hypothetical protein
VVIDRYIVPDHACAVLSDPLIGESMIPKSGYRFSEKIMLHQQAGVG